MNKLDKLLAVADLITDGSTGSTGIFDDIIGKYVIVRSRNEGVNCGTVVAADSTGIILEDARRLWYHKPKDASQSWYEGVANSGLSDDSQISPTVDRKLIVEDYSVTLCRKDAIDSLKSKKSVARND
jgi:hypothetical protein